MTRSSASIGRSRRDGQTNAARRRCTIKLREQKKKGRINIRTSALRVCGTRCREKVTFGRHRMLFLVLFFCDCVCALSSPSSTHGHCVPGANYRCARTSHFVIPHLPPAVIDTEKKREKNILFTLDWLPSTARLFFFGFFLSSLQKKKNQRLVYSWMQCIIRETGAVAADGRYTKFTRRGVRQVVSHLVFVDTLDIVCCVCVYTRT